MKTPIKSKTTTVPILVLFALGVIGISPMGAPVLAAPPPALTTIDVPGALGHF